MNHDLARRALEIFEQALDVPKNELQSFLDEACSGDAKLLAEVQSLLGTNEDASDFLPTVHSMADSTASAVKRSQSQEAGGKRLQLGSKLSDRYEILAVLGSGGMGEVYRARDLRLDREVAIKILNQASFADKGMQDRFDREMRSVASLFHPNIVTLFDVADDEEMKFAVMELVDGKTLRELISDGLDWQMTVRLAHDIATGLSVAHAQNIMHRDIKPENVIVTADNRAKVLDFGLARPESVTPSQDVTAGQFVPGTVPYMSPEQADRQELTCSTDIFSLGTVVYEMLTGTNPFRGSGFLDTMQNVSNASPPPISDYVKDIPDRLVSLVLSMLHRVATRRPTADEVTVDLNGILQSLSDSGASFSTSQILSSVPTNLPLRPVELTGRAPAINNISACLASSPIVTVLGPGGVGKTSVAIEIARANLDEYPGGVWLCEFAPIRNADGVAEIVAATLDGNAGAMSGVDEMVGRLLGAPTLLILDNCEHVIDAVAELAEALSRRVPNLTILATSRESLDVTGEHVVRLDGLGFEGRTSDAAELFVKRAVSLASYEDDPDRRHTVEEIVTRLEGLPLAIELAAPKLSVMSLDELLDALDDQVATLRTRRRSSDRQGTIQTAIAWSFDLLCPDEQELLLACSVFTAAFTSDAAIAVSGRTKSSKTQLQRLVEQSVVARKERKGKSRYRLLEPIRQFCQSQIGEAENKAARQRHAYHYASRAETLGQGINGFDEIESAVTLNAEWSDLRQAVAWGREHHVVEVAVDPMVALGRTLMFHLRVEAYQWLMEAEKQFGDEVANRADVCAVLAMGAWVMGNLEQTEAYIERAQEIEPLPQTLGAKYFLRFSQKRFEESAAAAEEALPLAKAKKNEGEIRWWSNALRACPLALGNPTDERIDQIIADATTFVSTLEWPSGTAFLFLAKATSALTRGNLTEAFAFRQQSIDSAERCGNRWIALINRLVIDDGLDPSVPPQQRLSTSIQNLRMLTDLGEEAHYPLAVRSIIMALVGCEQFEAAARFSGLVDALQGVGDKDEFTPQYRPTLEKLKESMGIEAFAALQDAGASMSVKDVLKSSEQLL